jgi:hypothetical protein
MSDKRLCEIRFEGRFADEHMLPVAALSQALVSMQRAVHLLAMQHEKISVRQRERVTKEVEAKYPLLCALPQPGSYAIPVQIGDPSAALFAEEDIENVSDLFSLCCAFLAGGDRAGLSTTIPDTTRRDRFIEAVRGMSPSLGSGIKAGLSQLAGPLRVSLDALHERGKECLSTAVDPERQVRTVIGRLSEINFDERKITIVYPVSSKELVCIYSEAVEEMLLERPREMIQMTGEIILDENDQPKKIINVESIDEVDLSPFYLHKIAYGVRSFEFTQPLELTPTLDDETKQLFCLENPELGLDVYAYTRDQLDLELKEQIAFLWDTYAQAPDEELTVAAIALKRKLLAALREVPRAA